MAKQILVYKTKTWKGICNKLPNKKQLEYIDRILKKYKVRNHQIKIIARFCEYDVKDDWVDRFSKVLKFIKDKGNVQTLEAAILKYGEEYGPLKYKETNDKKLNVIDTFIKRYGEEDGKKRYYIFCEKNKGNKTIERFVKLYGETNGKKLFKQLRDKEGEKGTLKYYTKKHGKALGKKIYKKRYESLYKGSSKESYIKKYGGIEGPKLFKESRDTTSLSSYQKRYGIEEGLKRYDRHIEKKRKTNSLEGFVERYGKVKGKRKYENWLKNSALGYPINRFTKSSQELFEAIDKPEENTFFARKNNEFKLKHETGNYFYDYVNLDRRKIIEYNGDIFHGNPVIFNQFDKPNPFDRELTCERMWERDFKKNKLAEESGFKVLTIWEKDYKMNKDEIIKKCNEFLYS